MVTAQETVYCFNCATTIPTEQRERVSEAYELLIYAVCKLERSLRAAYIRNLLEDQHGY